MSRSRTVLFALTATAALACLPAHALQRAFVSSGGNDANAATGCTLGGPCRSFATALTVVDTGGEVVALDAAGYGAVTITRSVTITANPGFYAGISAPTGTAVTIATGGVDVILRGLNINGVGATTGISMTDGNSLSIENCVVSNFTGTGISLSNPPGSSKVRIVNTLVRGNLNHGVVVAISGSFDMVNSTAVGNSGGAGVFATVNNGGVLHAHITNSVASQNALGFVADVETTALGTTKLDISGSTAANNQLSGFLTQNLAGGTVVLTVSGSSATGNAFGFNNTGGTFESTGNNTVRNNSTDLSGTIGSVGLH